MTRLFFGLVLLLGATPVFAYDPVTIEPDRPYEAIPVELDMDTGHEFLGTLNDFPETYEIISDQPFTLNVTAIQPAVTEPAPFRLIVIRENDRGGGVTEVVRMNVPVGEWTADYSPVLAMNIISSPSIKQELEPGVYRIEISTADNQGNYLLTFADYDGSFFGNLGAVWQTHQHFGVAWYRILASSLVYYTIGIVLLLLALYVTYANRKKIIGHGD